MISQDVLDILNKLYDDNIIRSFCTFDSIKQLAHELKLYPTAKEIDYICKVYDTPECPTERHIVYYEYGSIPGYYD